MERGISSLESPIESGERGSLGTPGGIPCQALSKAGRCGYSEESEISPGYTPPRMTGYHTVRKKLCAFSSLHFFFLLLPHQFLFSSPLLHLRKHKFNAFLDIFYDYYKKVTYCLHLPMALNSIFCSMIEASIELAPD